MGGQHDKVNVSRALPLTWLVMGHRLGQWIDESATGLVSGWMGFLLDRLVDGWWAAG